MTQEEKINQLVELNLLEKHMENIAKYLKSSSYYDVRSAIKRRREEIELLPVREHENLRTK